MWDTNNEYIISVWNPLVKCPVSSTLAKKEDSSFKTLEPLPDYMVS
jgi:hypothetical protein